MQPLVNDTPLKHKMCEHHNCDCVCHDPLCGLLLAIFLGFALIVGAIGWVASGFPTTILVTQKVESLPPTANVIFHPTVYDPNSVTDRVESYPCFCFLFKSCKTCWRRQMNLTLTLSYTPLDGGEKELKPITFQVHISKPVTSFMPISTPPSLANSITKILKTYPLRDTPGIIKDDCQPPCGYTFLKWNTRYEKVEKIDPLFICFIVVVIVLVGAIVIIFVKNCLHNYKIRLNRELVQYGTF